MSSVLVDFYNLDLQPNQIIEFFETHAPNIVRQLTEERKRQIQDFDSEFKSNLDGDIILNNKSLFMDSMTTLQGYEALSGISWFSSKYFLNFACVYGSIKDLLIDKYLDDCITSADRNWLESRINMYTDAAKAEKEVRNKTYIDNDPQDMVKSARLFSDKFEKIRQCPRDLVGIYFSIYKEAMSLLEGELDIDKCKICKNLFKPNRNNHTYCSPECRQAVDSRNKGKQSDKIHQELCELIDEWLGPKQESDWVDTLGLAGDLSKEFSIGFGYQNDLDRKNISEGLQWQFKDNGISLSDNATISIRDESSRWLITDKNKTYIIKKEKGGLNIIRKTFLLDKISPSKSLGSYFNQPKFEHKLEEEKKIIIQSRQKRKNKECNFLRI